MKKTILVISLALASLFAVPATINAQNSDNAAGTEAVEVAATQEAEAVEVSDTAAPQAAAAQKMETTQEKNERIKEADGAGVGVTLLSMGIVICALIILSILFMGFGKISQRMHARKKLEAHGVDPNVVTTDDSELDSGEAIAAIAAALHQHFSARHDVEDTVLTMRKLKRAYSPWSSKIYGLREIPNRNTWRR